MVATTLRLVHTASTARTRSLGKVFVFHGMESSLGAWWEGPDSIPSWEKLGAREAGGFGGSLSGGDFNGDGYGDLWLRR